MSGFGVGGTGRRAQVRAQRRNGIDGVEASDDGRVLTVTFLGRAPRELAASNIRIDGGRRITGIEVLGVALDAADDPELDDELRVTVRAPGDTSVYTLHVVEAGPRGGAGSRPYPGFDPRYSSARFTFRAQCPSDQDCLPVPAPPGAPLPGPVIDYTARDYDSLRRVLLDRAALTAPGWVERHVPDLQVTLVELLAYVGDQLSYAQDAVATEAYLDTARRRVSVRRHARLIDYRMHDGCNARTFVALEVPESGTVDAGSFRFAAVDLSRVDPRDRPDLAVVLADEELDRLPAAAVSTVFEPLSAGALALHPAHNEIPFWTWGGEECCLPTGATRATLRDTWLPGDGDDDHGGHHGDDDHGGHHDGDDRDGHHDGDDHGGHHDGGGQDGHRRARVLRLAGGDLLVIEELRGPGTGAAADADPTHRQVVRLTSVTPAVDDLYDQPVLEVAWAPEDAMRFPVCLSATGGPDCATIPDISVARGNVVAVDHGRSGTFCAGEPEHLDVPPAPVVLPGCDPPPGCPDRIEAGPAISAIHTLLAAALSGLPLSTEDLLVLRPLIGPAALDRAGLAPDAPAAQQAAALQALLTQLTYPPTRPRYRPVLRLAPVTQSTPYPSPGQVADGQAILLDAIADRARQRVEELWRAARDERRLHDDERDELALLFGQSTVDRLNLEDHPTRALRELLARFDLLLASKLARLADLAGRARDGTSLGDETVWEIRHTWGERYTIGLAPDSPALAGPASAVTGQDPRDALPAVLVRGLDATDRFVGVWTPRRDLLASGPRDRHLVGEVDDDGRLVLRFGSGGADPHGQPPPPGGTLTVGYRVGNGTAGNVGAEAVSHLLVCGAQRPAVGRVRNPVPATGGIDPEPVDVVRQLAPLAPRATRLRAVTADDYAELAQQVPGVQRAAAQRRWTGAGVEVLVAIDALGTELAGAVLLDRVDRAIEPYRRIGHDVVIAPARSIPLDVALRVCVDDGFQAGHVRTALLAALGAGLLADGRPAFFHPDALTFGEPVRVSRLVAAAVALDGVVSAQVTRLRRLGAPDGGELAAGLLRPGPLEIVQCDNVFDRPEHGRLSIVLEGGR